MGRADHQAASEFRIASELSPSLTEAHRELAAIGMRSHDWDTAAAELQALLAWDWTDAQAHRDLALVLKTRGDLDDAARELGIARKLNPALGQPR